MNFLKAFILLCMFSMTTAFAANVCSRETPDGSYQCCTVTESETTCCNFNPHGYQGCNTIKKPIPKPPIVKHCRLGNQSPTKCCPPRVPFCDSTDPGFPN
jgi:hypothetical protein